MEEYLAKSNPRETLEEHTLALLESYNEFKSIYPEINIDWMLLKKAIIYHDMGKINEKFQKKIRGELNKNGEDEIPHGYLSIGFIDYKTVFDDDYNIKKIDNYDLVRRNILAASIYFHHNRKSMEGDYQDVKKILQDELDKLKSKNINFLSEELDGISVKKIPSQKYFRFEIPGVCDDDFNNNNRNMYLEFCKIKGMLNKIDYAASSHEKIEYKNDFLELHMENVLNEFKKRNKNACWNELQKYMIENKDKNIVAIAQTGMGKTEAGLLWIGNNKGFFTLPLKTAINSIYSRVISQLSGNISEKVGLLHSDIASQYIKLLEEDELKFDLDDYIYRTKQLCVPVTICTIDQIFDFVFKYLGCEVKMATLSYSKVIIDEIQMYSPNLIAIIITALEYIVSLGGKFAILTATMPPFIIDEMKKKGIEFETPEPFLTDLKRHSIKVIDDNINSDFIKQKYDNNKVLVICNTVKKAQQLFNDLCGDDNLFGKIHLFHGGFIKRDREKIEKEILSFTEKGNSETGIWICTQVVEASLDIDFDILITELSDLNGLFQRLGRCYRKREFTDDGYNCFIFVGGCNSIPSGIGRVIDRDIFELSRECIKDVDGIISEDEKQELIKTVYSAENIKKTDYYKEYAQSIKYINFLYVNEMNKKDVLRLFRNINTIEVIPKSVYEANYLELEKHINNLKSKIEDSEQIKILRAEKLKSKEYIQSLMVSIPAYIFANLNSQKISISRYFEIIVADIEYDEILGVSRINKIKKEAVEDIFDRMV